MTDSAGASLDGQVDIRGCLSPDSAYWLDLIRHGLDALPDSSVMLFDQDFRYLLVRGGVLDEEGFRSQELEGHLASEILSPERWEFYQPLYQQALLGVSTSMETKSPDGDRDFAVRVGPVRDDAGIIVAGIAIATDTSNSRRDMARLRESEERYRLMAENTSDFVVRLSPNGVIEWVSPSLTEILGWQPMEVLGRHVLNFAHPEDQEDVQEFTRRLREGALNRGRARVRLADGTYRWFSRVMRPIHDDDGAIVAFASSWRDVEAEVVAERLLQESEQQLRQAMDMSSIGMMMTASDGTFLKVNLAICHMLGYEQSELQGMTFFDVTHPDDIAVGAQSIRDLASGVIRSFKQRKRYLTKQGSIVWVDLSTTAIVDSEGAFRHTVTQIVDVTTEVLNYEALQRSARQFRLLAENASDVVYQTDLGGVIQWVSPSVSHVLGWDPELLVGVRSASLIHPDDLALVEDLRNRIVAGEVVPAIVIRYRSSGGPTREMSGIGRPIRSNDGSLTGISVSLRDVTQEQTARRELARSEEQFRLAMANAPHGMLLTDAAGVVLQVNRSMLELLNIDERQSIGRLITDVLGAAGKGNFDEHARALLAGERDTAREEHTLRSGDRELWVDHATSLQRDEAGRPIFFVHQFADQTAARDAAAQHEWLAHHDELTSVLNRRGGNLLLAQALESVSSLNEVHGLLFVDVDNFKDFNTRGGEESGDAVLAAVATRLMHGAGPEHDVVRWGGDEFLVLVRDIGDEVSLTRVAEQVRAAASRPVDVGEHMPEGYAEVTVSVVATLVSPDDTVKTLITRASEPLSRAKKQGRNRVTVQL